MPASIRRFLVVGEPFYRVGEERFTDVSAVPGDIVTADAFALADEDGDLLVNVTHGDESVDYERVSLEALVEINEDGYPLVLPDVLLEGEADAELLAALAPLAVVILRGAL